MKVLHVIDRLEVGGAEKVFVSITKLLAVSNITTGALLFTAGYHLDKELDKRVQLHVLNRTNKYSLFTLYRAHKTCSNYDIVQAHLRHVYAYIRLAQWLFGGKYKLVMHDHAAITNDIPKRFSGILKPKYYIGVNKEQTNWATATVGIKNENVFLLENTITPTTNPKTETSTHNDFMMVANIRSVKNIGFAIELAKRMNYPLHIYGNIIENDYYNKLRQHIAENKDITIRQGVTDFKDVYSQYKMAIHCSPAETGPLVLIEYLAAGLPFIAFKTGSAAETIAADLPQLFMNNFEYADWQQRIQETFADKTLPEKMKALFAEKFSPKDYINKCLNIYKKIYS